MADVLLDLDLPTTKCFVAACTSVSQLHAAFQFQTHLDLSSYELWEKRKSGELVPLNLNDRQGLLLVMGRLKTLQKPACDSCGRASASPSDLSAHFATCKAGPLAVNPLSAFRALYSAL